MPGRLRIPATVQPVVAIDRGLARRLRLPVSRRLVGVDFVIVTEISTSGALIITPVPMQLGDQVQLRLPMMEPVTATLMWVSNRLAGCEFDDQLHPALLRVLLSAAKANPDEWQRSLLGGPFGAH